MLCAIVAVGATGCGGDDDPIAVNTSSGDHSWGEVHTGRTISVSATRPDEVSTRDGTDAWRTTIVVTNQGQRPFNLGWLTTGASADGARQSEVMDPRLGCNGIAQGPTVLPGETLAVMGCWPGSDQRLVSLSWGGVTESALFSD